MNLQIIKAVSSLIIFMFLIGLLILLRKNKIEKNNKITLLVLSGITLLFTIFSFNKNGALLYDSGRTLHTPIRILAGEHIYKDIDWLYGPLEPYLNAFLYKIFGVNYMVLQIEGIIFLFAIMFLFYFIMNKIFSTELSLLLTLLFLAYHAFTPQGLIIPYSYSFTYGLFFLFLSLLLFMSYIETNNKKFLVSSAFGLGLLAITHQTYTFALIMGTFGIFIMRMFREKQFKKYLKDPVIYYSLSSIIPLLTYGFFVIISSFKLVKENMIPSHVINSFGAKPYYIILQAFNALLDKNYMLLISHSMSIFAFLLAFVGIIFGFYFYKKKLLDIELKERFLLLNLFFVFMLPRLILQGMLVALLLTSIGFIYFYFEINGKKYLKWILIIFIVILISMQTARGIGEFYGKGILIKTERIHAYTGEDGKAINEVLNYLGEDKTDYNIVAAQSMTIYYFLLEKQNVLRNEQIDYGRILDKEREGATIQRIEDNKIKYVLISNFGNPGEVTIPYTKEPKQFGVNYNLGLMSYVHENYVVDRTFGEEEGYFVTLYKRKE